MFVEGMSVECFVIWAGGTATLAHWVGGYVFVREDVHPVRGLQYIVKHTAGLYAGIEVRHAPADVRKVA
jgi:hypothetical protein